MKSSALIYLEISLSGKDKLIFISVLKKNGINQKFLYADGINLLSDRRNTE
jgi:hypothetical protein